MIKPTPPRSLLYLLGQVVLGLVLLLLLGYYLWPTLFPVLRYIYNDDNYSAALLLPLVIGYIIYRKRQELRQPWESSWWGLLVLALGFGIYFAGAVLTIKYISTLAIVVMLMGIVWLLGGRRVVRLLAFPFFLLAISVPLPQFFISKLTLRMQVVSTQLAADILRLLGYPVGVFGNVIDMGDRQMQVVAACSGLGYLITATALAIIFCYFFQRQIWKVAVLLVAMIPFAIVANAGRLITIAIWPIFEKGIWHTSIGLTVFMLGLDYLRGLNWILNRLSPPPVPASDLEPSSAEVPAPLGPEETAPTRPWLAAYPQLLAGLIMIVVLAPVAVTGVETVPVPLKQDLNKFPMELGSWQGRHVHIDPALVAATGADTFLNAEFINPEKKLPVDLWIAYYENQRTGASVHSPNTCLTGSGWKTVRSEVVEILPGKPVNFAILEHAGNRMAMFFWYYERGRWLASDYGHKLSIAYDRLVSRRADGALVRLTTLVKGDEKEARDRLESFLKQFAPVLPEFMPGDS